MPPQTATGTSQKMAPEVNAELRRLAHDLSNSSGTTTLKNADAAMYHAKELGRNGFRAFTPFLHRPHINNVALAETPRGSGTR